MKIELQLSYIPRRLVVLYLSNASDAIAVSLLSLGHVMHVTRR